MNILNTFEFAVYTSRVVQFVFRSLFICSLVWLTMNIQPDLPDFTESFEELGSTYF